MSEDETYKIVRQPDRYFLKVDEGYEWFETTKERYVAAERASGFHNTLGQPDEPATASFSSTQGFQGKIQYGRSIQTIANDGAKLLEEIISVVEKEKYTLSADKTQVTIRTGFFKELIEARAQLWGLESAGVDSWDGYASAMQECAHDADWVKEIDQ